LTGADCDVDEAIGDDLDVDGEADAKQDDTAGQSFCPSTDIIIVVENPGTYSTRYCTTVVHKTVLSVLNDMFHSRVILR